MGRLLASWARSGAKARRPPPPAVASREEDKRPGCSQAVWAARRGPERSDRACVRRVRGARFCRLDNAAAGHPPVSLLSSHGRSGLVLMGGNPAAHQAQSGSSYLTLHDTVNSPNLNVRWGLLARGLHAA